MSIFSKDIQAVIAWRQRIILDDARRVLDEFVAAHKAIVEDPQRIQARRLLVMPKSRWAEAGIDGREHELFVWGVYAAVTLAVLTHQLGS